MKRLRPIHESTTIKIPASTPPDHNITAEVPGICLCEPYGLAKMLFWPKQSGFLVIWPQPGMAKKIL